MELSKFLLNLPLAEEAAERRLELEEHAVAREPKKKMISRDIWED